MPPQLPASQPTIYRTAAFYTAPLRCRPGSCLVLGASTASVLLWEREAILRPFHLRPPVHALTTPYWLQLVPLVPLLLLNSAISGILQVCTVGEGGSISSLNLQEYRGAAGAYAPMAPARMNAHAAYSVLT